MGTFLKSFDTIAQSRNFLDFLLAGEQHTSGLSEEQFPLGNAAPPEVQGIPRRYPQTKGAMLIEV